MGNTSSEVGMSMILPFDDQSSSFTYGFEAGTVWQRMVQVERLIERSIPYRAENRALYLRMSAVIGYDAEVSATLDKDWIDITFRKQPKFRPFSAVPKSMMHLTVYWDLLASADWFHMMSESQATYEKGKRDLDELRAIGKQSEDHAKLFTDFENAIHNGRPMPNRPGEKQ